MATIKKNTKTTNSSKSKDTNHRSAEIADNRTSGEVNNYVRKARRSSQNKKSIFLEAEAISDQLSLLPGKRPDYFDNSHLKGLLGEKAIEDNIQILRELDVDSYIQRTIAPSENQKRLSAPEIIQQLGGKMVVQETDGPLYIAELEFQTQGRVRRFGFIAQNRKVQQGVWYPKHHLKAAEKLRFFASHGMPLITFMDTPGAAADSAANLANQSHAISFFISEMANLQLPSVGIVYGHGYSGGAIPLATTNLLLCVKDGVFNTIHPKGLSNITRKYNLSWQECAKYIGVSSYELYARDYFDGVIDFTPEHLHLLPNLQAAILSAVECIENNAITFLKQNQSFFEHYKENIGHYLNPSELMVEENRRTYKSPTGTLNIFGSVCRFLRYLRIRQRITSQSVHDYSRLSHLNVPTGALQERLAKERQEKFHKWLLSPLEIRYHEQLSKKYEQFVGARENREKERGKLATFFMGNPKENFKTAVEELTYEILLYLYNYWKGDANENLIQLEDYLNQNEASGYDWENPTLLDILWEVPVREQFRQDFLNIILFDLLYNGVVESLALIAGELKGNNQISQESVEKLFENAFELAIKAFNKRSLNVEALVTRESFFKWLAHFIAQKNCDDIMANISEWKQLVFPRHSQPLFGLVRYYFSFLLPSLYLAQTGKDRFDGKINPRNIGIKDFWNRLDQAYKDLLIHNLLREYKRTPIPPEKIIDHFFDSFKELNSYRMTTDPVTFPGFRQSIEQSLDNNVTPCGVITGIATYSDGDLKSKVGLVISNPQFQAGAFDMASCEKVCKLLAECARLKLAVVMFISSGGMQTKEGAGALFSMSIMNDRITRFVKDNDLPIICFGYRDCMGGAQASFVTHLMVRTYYFSGTQMSFAGQLVVESHLTAKSTLSNYLSANPGSMDGLVFNPFDEGIDAKLSQIDPQIPMAQITVKEVISRILAGEYRLSFQEDKSEEEENLAEQLRLSEISRVLIHARGCTAARLIQGAHAADIEVVLVQSDPDMESFPAKLLNENDRLVCIGGRTPQESYLNAMSVILIALHEDADALHPGIGFLSESPKYARVCREHGINFIGPTALNMDLMGNKSNAIATAKRLKVPVVPGSEGALTDPVHALTIADKIGFPVLIKAAHGGGGKGICVVENREDFIPLFSRMSQEAFNAFGNGDLYLEKYIISMRHLEVQIIRDSQGNANLLGIRDCSLQRNFQKLLEESAYELPKKITQQLYHYTQSLINEINYIGAGTVEFIYDRTDNCVYFMEMNTRLQVEHPVTEMVSRVDLVHQQFQIAAGNSIKDLEIENEGHAIELRINAERVELDADGKLAFIPEPGYLTEVFLPEDQHVRILQAVSKGSTVSPYYDSLIVQIIGWGQTRAEAIRNLSKYLERVRIHGVSTSLALMRAILKDSTFQTGNYDTKYLDSFLHRIDPTHLIDQTKRDSGASGDSVDQQAIVIPGTNEIKVLSPQMGNFFRANSPDEESFVKEGQIVDTDHILCLLESMKVFSELSLSAYKTADGEPLYSHAATYNVKKIIADDGQTVSQGDLLFVIEPVVE